MLYFVLWLIKTTRATALQITFKTKPNEARENFVMKTLLISVLRLIGWEGGANFFGPITAQIKTKPIAFYNIVVLPCVFTFEGYLVSSTELLT